MTENEARETLEIFDRERKEYMASMPSTPYFDRVKADDFTQSLNIAIEALEEIQQYREIGTAEECREAREKQIGKKPNKSDVHPYFRKHCSNIYSCPFCNKKLTHHKQKFCQYCGQAIDWSK